VPEGSREVPSRTEGPWAASHATAESAADYYFYMLLRSGERSRYAKWLLEISREEPRVFDPELLNQPYSNKFFRRFDDSGDRAVVVSTRGQGTGAFRLSQLANYAVNSRFLLGLEDEADVLRQADDIKKDRRHWIAFHLVPFLGDVDDYWLSIRASYGMLLSRHPEEKPVRVREISVYDLPGYSGATPGGDAGEMDASGPSGNAEAGVAEGGSSGVALAPESESEALPWWALLILAAVALAGVVAFLMRSR